MREESEIFWRAAPGSEPLGIHVSAVSKEHVKRRAKRTGPSRDKGITDA